VNAGIQVVVDGEPFHARPGETVAGLLLRVGVRSWRPTPGASPHGLFCGIGACFDCTLTVDGRPHVRACIIPVHPRMSIDTGGGDGR